MSEQKQESALEVVPDVCPRCSYATKLGAPEIEDDLKAKYMRSLLGDEYFSHTFRLDADTAVTCQVPSARIVELLHTCLKPDTTTFQCAQLYICCYVESMGSTKIPRITEQGKVPEVVQTYSEAKVQLLGQVVSVFRVMLNALEMSVFDQDFYKGTGLVAPCEAPSTEPSTTQDA